jgi:Ku70/Ku80 beta-barrel domain
VRNGFQSLYCDSVPTTAVIDAIPVAVSLLSSSDEFISYDKKILILTNCNDTSLQQLNKETREEIIKHAKNLKIEINVINCDNESIIEVDDFYWLNYFQLTGGRIYASVREATESTSPMFEVNMTYAYFKGVLEFGQRGEGCTMLSFPVKLHFKTFSAKHPDVRSVSVPALFGYDSKSTDGPSSSSMEVATKYFYRANNFKGEETREMSRIIDRKSLDEDTVHYQVFHILNNEMDQLESISKDSNCVGEEEVLRVAVYGATDVVPLAEIEYRDNGVTTTTLKNSEKAFRIISIIPSFKIKRYFYMGRTQILCSDNQFEARSQTKFNSLVRALSERDLSAIAYFVPHNNGHPKILGLMPYKAALESKELTMVAFELPFGDDMRYNLDECWPLSFETKPNKEQTEAMANFVTHCTAPKLHIYENPIIRRFWRAVTYRDQECERLPQTTILGYAKNVLSAKEELVFPSDIFAWADPSNSEFLSIEDKRMKVEEQLERTMIGVVYGDDVCIGADELQVPDSNAYTEGGFALGIVDWRSSRARRHLKVLEDAFSKERCDLDDPPRKKMRLT